MFVKIASFLTIASLTLWGLQACNSNTSTETQTNNELTEAVIQESKVLIYTLSTCPYCRAAKQLLTDEKISFNEVSVDNNQELRDQLAAENGGWNTVPMVFIKGKFVGGYTDLKKLHESGELAEMLSED